MTWPPQSPDINPIENLWSTVKRELYPGDQQYKSKAELWDAIQRVCAALRPQDILNLTQSMDDRLFKVVQNNRGLYKDVKVFVIGAMDLIIKKNYFMNYINS